MGLSLRAYARHRGVSHTAVQKALRTGRIAVLPDGTIDAVAADAAWNQTAESASRTGVSPGDATRVVLPAGSLSAAETLVRAVLAEHGAPAGATLTMQDARLANELLRARQRAEAIRAERARVRYMTGVDLDAEDDAARAESVGWWRWSDATAATLARALGVTRARVIAVLAPAMRARLRALGLVAGDDDEEEDEEDDAGHEREDEDDQEDDDADVEPLRVEPDADDQEEELVAAEAVADEQAGGDEDAGAEDDTDEDAGADDQGAAEDTALGPPAPAWVAAVAPTAARAEDLDPEDEPLEEDEAVTGTADSAPLPVPEPASVPSPSAAPAADPTASAAAPPIVVPIPGTAAPVTWRRSTYWDRRG